MQLAQLVCHTRCGNRLIKQIALLGNLVLENYWFECKFCLANRGNTVIELDVFFSGVEGRCLV
jgi:hypothetical protein